MAKVNVYEMVTERFIEELEKGIIPWQKPWSGVRTGAFNRVSKKAYSILNQMMLKHTGEYATFKQWSELGGKIKKGECGIKPYRFPLGFEKKMIQRNIHFVDVFILCCCQEKNFTKISFLPN